MHIGKLSYFKISNCILTGHNATFLRHYTQSQLIPTVLMNYDDFNLSFCL